MKALFLAALLGIATQTSACPIGQPTPPPGSAGAGGVVVSGAGGAPGGASGAPQGGQGGAGGFGGAGGQAPAPEPLCTLPPPPWGGPDAALDKFAAEHRGAVEALGLGPASAWLVRREPFFGPGGPTTTPGTTLVAIAPKGSSLTPAQLAAVVAKMAGGGYASTPQADGTGGFRNPCAASGVPRQPGLARDVPALPSLKASDRQKR